MARRERQWVWVKLLGSDDKAVIAASCERFIADVLKPRFLPEIRPTDWNYPVDIFGKWRGSKYEAALHLVDTDPVLRPPI